MRTVLLLISIVGLIIPSSAQELFKTNSAKIEFVSNAPLEFITAKSTNCQGILSLESGKFVFRVFIKTFDGFNNPIQKGHFYENYLETNEYPESIFQGFVVEKINLNNTKELKIRAKGELSIHGVTQEIIIPVNLSKQNNGNLSFTSSFEILLDDYNISIPSIVKQKIAEKIRIQVDGILENQIE